MMARRIDAPPEPYGSLCARFVRHKRALGYKYGRNDELSVMRLGRHLAERGDGSIMPEEAVMEWCRKRPGEAPGTLRIRANVARQFGLFLRSEGIECYVLPKELVPSNKSVFTPYILTREQISAVTKVLDEKVPPVDRPAASLIHATLFRVLYGCGMRISEALALAGDDVDLERGVFNVASTKGQGRLVPMSESLLMHCRSYAQAMGDCVQGGNPFFPGENYAAPLTRSSSLSYMKSAFEAAGVARPDGTPPRIHDLRHTFACHALEAAEAAGTPAESVLPILATYMGHSTIASTEYYLHLTDSSRNLVADAMEGACATMFPEVPDE